MKKGILLLNGDPYTGNIDASDSCVWCCDGAYAWAKDKVRIDVNIGDYDSLDETPSPEPSAIYPREKDFTDGEMALHGMLEDGVEDITIYGAFGGREDHFMGNLHLLLAAHRSGVKIRMCSENTLIFPGSGRIELGAFIHKTVSVFPLYKDAHIKNSARLKYKYPKILRYGTCRGVSNIVEEEDAFIETDSESTVLIFVNVVATR